MFTTPYCFSFSYHASNNNESQHLNYFLGLNMRNAPFNLFVKLLHSANRHSVMSPTSLPEPPTSYKNAKQETKQRSYTMLQVLAYTISYTMFPFDHNMHKKNEVGIH